MLDVARIGGAGLIVIGGALVQPHAKTSISKETLILMFLWQAVRFVGNEVIENLGHSNLDWNAVIIPALEP